MFLIFACISLATKGLAEDSLAAFSFDPNKVKLGSTYHYIKTNIDGTHPELIIVHLASKNRIEVIKKGAAGGPPSLVVAEMDWDTFSVEKLASFVLDAQGQKTLMARLTFDKQQKHTVLDAPIMGQTGLITPIPYLPFHVYNFNLTSLNVSLRHLIEPERDFKIGLADPTFRQNGQLFYYRGAVTITFEGREERDGETCRKYKIDGEGLQGRGGFFWVHEQAGHIVDLEIQTPDNPAWRSFKLKLQKLETLTPDQWARDYKRQP